VEKFQFIKNIILTFQFDYMNEFEFFYLEKIGGDVDAS